MTAALIEGAAIAAGVREDVRRRVAAMARPPVLATVLVGDDPASEIYIARKRATCVELGMRDLHHRLPADVTQAEAGALLASLSLDRDVNGILLQLPLPAHLDARRLLALIHPDKDVDGLTSESAGRLALGEPGLRPCTPMGVMALLDAHEVAIAGAEAVVVGRSDLVGRPLAQMLLERDATVTSCHKGTRDLSAETRRADVLVVAAGVRDLIRRDDVKPGATVVDVGIHRTAEGVRGDVAFAEVAEVAGLMTPVPGGVGPMTIAMLMANTADAVVLQDRARRAAREDLAARA